MMTKTSLVCLMGALVMSVGVGRLDAKNEGSRVRVASTAGDATASIQGEIDRAFAAGGGTVVLGKG